MFVTVRNGTVTLAFVMMIGERFVTVELPPVELMTPPVAVIDVPSTLTPPNAEDVAKGRTPGGSVAEPVKLAAGMLLPEPVTVRLLIVGPLDATMPPVPVTGTRKTFDDVPVFVSPTTNMVEGFVPPNSVSPAMDDAGMPVGICARGTVPEDNAEAFKLVSPEPLPVKFPLY